jgi:endonuclease/exonuclease/phosphatase (EEP) superfamily protein YafD
VAVWLAWSFLLVVYLVVMFAWLWRYDLERTGVFYDRLALGTFLVRVLGVHVGMAGLLVLLAALVLRRWRYAVACAPVIVFLLWPVHGGFGGGGAIPTPRDGEIVVMSVNLRRGADGAEAVVRRIADVDPDILVLQEYTDDWHESIGSDLDARFAHAFTSPRPDPQGIATYSNLDVVEEEELQLGRWEYPALRSTFRLAGGDELVLYDVHIAMPLSRNAHVEQRRQVARLSTLLRDEHGAAIVMGDLNFTETTQHFDELLDADMRSAWDELRSGRGITWSRLGGIQGRVPGLRLDHLLGTDEVEFGGIARGERGESDHWPLVATLSVRDH